MTSLTRDDTFTTAEAECIAGVVFDEYGENEEALAAISGAVDYAELASSDVAEGFDQFFRNTVAGCTNT